MWRTMYQWGITLLTLAVFIPQLAQADCRYVTRCESICMAMDADGNCIQTSQVCYDVPVWCDTSLLENPLAAAVAARKQ